MPRDKLIPNEKIQKGKRIGNGQFGEVYKGKAIVCGLLKVCQTPMLIYAL